jgi:hypothetical protein
LRHLRRTPLPAARARTLAGEALAAAGRRDEAVRELQRAEADLSALCAARYRDEAAHQLRLLGERVSAPPAAARRREARRAVRP